MYLFLTMFSKALSYEERRVHSMKKYMAPAMETLDFNSNEVIAGALSSSLFNDGEFDWSF